jgi:hypothetical protein
MAAPATTDRPEVDERGSRKWRNAKGQFHRLDGPAIEYADGSREWWVDGQQHRNDGPAIDHANGHKEWWVGGRLHRLDGPALEYANGDREWFVDDRLHRLDGPAVEYASGCRGWYVDGVNVAQHTHHAAAEEFRLSQGSRVKGCRRG